MSQDHTSDPQRPPISHRDAVALAAATVVAGRTSGADAASPDGTGDRAHAEFAMDTLLAELKKGDGPWHAFFEAPTMTLGVYHLATGATDGQQPHDRDEVYYVVGGRATFTVDGHECPAEPGAVLFVKAGVEHRFSRIAEDLTLLVFFSGKNAGAA